MERTMQTQQTAVRRMKPLGFAGATGSFFAKPAVGVGKCVWKCSTRLERRLDAARKSNVQSTSAAAISRGVIARRRPVSASVARGGSVGAEATRGSEAKLEQKLNWLANWVPLGVVEDLPRHRPTQVVVLGRPLVVFFHAVSQTWTVLDDVCPHRFAPLSEGRLEPQSGDLQCSYHGWQFNQCGSCTRIPQLSSPSSSSPSSPSILNRAPRVDSYPIREDLGFLWAWLDVSTGSSSSSSPLPIPRVAHDARKDNKPIFSLPYVRELPIEWEFLIENVVDPSHVPWSHHGIQGTRDRAGPLDMALVPLKTAFDTANSSSSADGEAVGVLERDGFGARSPFGSILEFQAPFMAAYDMRMRDGFPLGRWSLCTWSVPVRPGLTRILFSIVSEKPNRKRRWVDHLERNDVLDGDTIFIPYQREILRRCREQQTQQQQQHAGSRSESNAPERRDYWMPAKSDAVVVGFRRWFEKFCASTVPYAPGTREHVVFTAPESTGRFRRRELIDRMKQHTQFCSACSGAHRNFTRLASVLKYAAVTVPALTIVLTLARMSWIHRSASAIPTSSLLLAVAPTIALSAVLSVALLALQSFVKTSVISKFEFVDYVHSEK